MGDGEAIGANRTLGDTGGALQEVIAHTGQASSGGVLTGQTVTPTS